MPAPASRHGPGTEPGHRASQNGHNGRDRTGHVPDSGGQHSDMLAWLHQQACRPAPTRCPWHDHAPAPTRYAGRCSSFPGQDWTSEVGEHQLPNRVRRLHGDLTAILRAGPKLVRERRGAAAVSRGRRRNLRHSVWSDRRPLVILGDPVAVAGDVAQSTSARATPLRRRRAGSSFGRVRSRLVQDAASWRGIRPETSLIRIALGTRRINVNVDEQAIGSSRCRS
jgi:hypothetical protein